MKHADRKRLEAKNRLVAKSLNGKLWFRFLRWVFKSRKKG